MKARSVRECARRVCSGHSCAVPQESPEIKPPQHVPPAPASLEPDWRSHNKALCLKFATNPVWDPFQAPWPKGTRCRWYENDVWYGSEFEISQVPQDCADVWSFFWTSQRARVSCLTG